MILQTGKIPIEYFDTLIYSLSSGLQINMIKKKCMAITFVQIFLIYFFEQVMKMKKHHFFQTLETWTLSTSSIHTHFYLYKKQVY